MTPRRKLLAPAGCIVALLALAACAGGESASAPPPPPTPQTTQTIVVRAGDSLIVNNWDPDLSKTVVTDMVECFFTVYPAMRARFNPGARRSVILTFDPSRTGVAFASNGAITVASAWMRSNPRDVDVITHEAFHVVQSYPPGNPGWSVEGLADYARDRYGCSNAAGGWSLPNLSATHKYTDAYRVTARFYKWLEVKVDPKILEALDVASRAGLYGETFWTQRTGKTIDQLWADYVANPAF